MRISDWSSDVCSSDLSFSAAASREIILGGANTYTGVTGIGGAGVVKASVLADGGTASSLGTNTNINLSGALIYTGTGDSSDRIWTANGAAGIGRSEEHTSELQSLMRISYAVFCLKKNKKHNSI